jgi:hypothetical protein
MEVYSVMEKQTLERLVNIVRDAASTFGGVYGRIWDSIRDNPDSAATVSFLSIYGHCMDVMDFVLAYELPALSINSNLRMRNAKNART